MSKSEISKHRFLLLLMLMLLLSPFSARITSGTVPRSIVPANPANQTD